MTTTYDNPPEGLYFDGCRAADDIDAEIIGLAERYGWECPDTEQGDLSNEEHLSEVADEAIDFLNSLETRDGYYWGYGDNAEGFGLWAEEGGAP